ncbi:hypothetical protein vBAmePPT11V19_00069 [Alteromonas phage vB_AmeP_PT11-V19]|nr:hypothetical protein vBAmePPT11V19_00069 [Alteromonas phage vB_AmeP_PT11-V19]
MLVLEFILGHLLTSALFNKFKRPAKNNVPKIKKLSKSTNHVKTVGELKALLDNFADDTPFSNTSREWLHLQVREGWIHIGQVQQWGDD